METTFTLNLHAMYIQVLCSKDKREEAFIFKLSELKIETKTFVEYYVLRLNAC